MAIKALNLHDTKEVVFPGDNEDPTIWVIGAIDSRTFGSLSDRSLVVGVDPANPDGEADVKMAKNVLSFEVAQFGLKGFRNFRDESGDVQFRTESKVVGSTKYDVAHGSIVSRIPGKVLTWLSQQIIDMNSLGLEEGNA